MYHLLECSKFEHKFLCWINTKKARHQPKRKRNKECITLWHCHLH
jgi:hypothetical protein